EIAFPEAARGHAGFRSKKRQRARPRLRSLRVGPQTQAERPNTAAKERTEAASAASAAPEAARHRNDHPARRRSARASAAPAATATRKIATSWARWSETLPKSTTSSQPKRQPTESMA